MRRSAVTGIGVVAPGGTIGRRSGTRSPRAERRRAGSPSSTPQASARRSRRRRTSTRARPGSTSRRSLAWTATCSSPSPRRIEAVRDSGLDLETRRPRPHGRHARQRRRRDDGSGGRVRGGHRTAAGSGSSTPSTRRRSCYHALVPSTLATEVALRFGAHGPAVGRLHRMHVGHRRASATATS